MKLLKEQDLKQINGGYNKWAHNCGWFAGKIALIGMTGAGVYFSGGALG